MSKEAELEEVMYRLRRKLAQVQETLDGEHAIGRGWSGVDVEFGACHSDSMRAVGRRQRYRGASKSKLR